MLAGVGIQPVSAQEDPGEFSVFWEVWNYVNSDFVDRDKVDFTEMTYGAIRGMLATLGDDNHTVFFTPEEAEQQASSLQGEFEGIGAYVGMEEGVFRILAPIHGSPAEAAGLLAGDIVLKVDGDEIMGKEEWEIISLIRGPAGSDVTLTIMHPESDEAEDVTITRGRIQVDSVTWAPIPGTDLAYLQICAVCRRHRGRAAHGAAGDQRPGACLRGHCAGPAQQPGRLPDGGAERRQPVPARRRHHPLRA